MNPALKVALTLFGIYIFIKAFTGIAKFVGVSEGDYINYLLWIAALVLFWLFLPRQEASIFFN